MDTNILHTASKAPGKFMKISIQSDVDIQSKNANGGEVKAHMHRPYKTIATFGDGADAHIIDPRLPVSDDEIGEIFK